MRTREELLKKMLAHTAGVIGLGSAKVRRLITAPIESAASFGQTILELDETATMLLNQIYDFLASGEPQQKVDGIRTNGLAKPHTQGAAPAAK